MAYYQNFLKFKELDPGNNITRTKRKVTWTNSNRNEYASVTRNFSNNFWGNFEHKFTHELNDRTPGPNPPVMFWGLSNGQYSLQDIINNANGLVMYWSSNDNYLVLWYLNPNSFDTSVVLSLNTTYYFTVSRISSTITAKVYSDSTRETLVDTLSVTGSRLFYTYLSYASYDNVTTSATSTGYVEKVDLGIGDETSLYLSLTAKGFQGRRVGYGGRIPRRIATRHHVHDRIY